MNQNEFTVVYSSSSESGKTQELVKSLIVKFINSKKEILKVKFETPETKILEAEIATLRDALLNADRYFKAKSGEYFCNVGLCETSASYAVDRALTQTRAPLLLEIVKAVEDKSMDGFRTLRLENALTKYRE